MTHFWNQMLIFPWRSFIILPYFATISKVKSQFLTLNLYCVPFVWIPNIQNKFCEIFEGLLSFSVLISSHGPETPVKLKIRFSKFVQNFRKFSEFWHWKSAQNGLKSKCQQIFTVNRNIMMVMENNCYSHHFFTKNIYFHHVIFDMHPEGTILV